MSDPTWTDVVQAIAAVGSAVATVGVAVVGWRIDRNQREAEQRQHLRDVAAGVREQQARWSARVLRGLPATTSVRYDPVEAPVSVAMLRREGADVGLIEAQARLIAGHISLVRVFDGNTSWREELHRDRRPVRETVEELVSGCLDITKDELFDRNDGDYYLAEGFWSQLEAPWLLHGADTEQILNSQRENVDELTSSGFDKWILPGMSASVRMRAQLLVRYKVQLEHELAVMMCGQFTNLPESMPRDERFAIALRGVAGQLDDDMSRLVDQAAAQLEERPVKG